MKNEEQIAIPQTQIEDDYDMSRLVLYMLGHAHIDLCYRWDIEETVHRISPMTFKGVLEVMERTPNFTFCQSQLFLYEAMEKMYPQIFSQILKWIGPDGSGVVAFQPFGHYSNPSFTAEYVQELQGYAKNGVTDYDLALYGTGDHGGGLRDEDILALESIKNLPTMPKWRYSTAHDFFARTFNEATVAELGTHTGNLQSFATGAITSQARIKRENRICERLLLATESAATAATPASIQTGIPAFGFSAPVAHAIDQSVSRHPSRHVRRCCVSEGGRGLSAHTSGTQTFHGG